MAHRRWSVLMLCFLAVLLVSLPLIFIQQRPSWQRLAKDSRAWNCPSSSPKDVCSGESSSSSRSESLNMTSSPCPSYFGLIHEDLSPWSESGITRQSLEDAKSRGASMHVAIVHGKLYVRAYGDCPQSRPLFTLQGILQLLDEYPGQVPDVEFMLNCKDRPIAHKTAAPVFSYCKTVKDKDILMPDYSYWGWPEVRIDPWDLQSNEIMNSSSQIDWASREPSAFWKGNANMGKVRSVLLGCKAGTDIHHVDWRNAPPQSTKLSQQCKNRYNIYVEGAAWSASLKYRMACGSTLLYIASDYYDFFSRALVPGIHYLRIPSDKRNLCDSIREAVEWGNTHAHGAETIGNKGQKFIKNELSMQHVSDYLLHLLVAYAKLQRFTPSIPNDSQQLCSKAIQCIASDRAKAIITKLPSKVLQPCHFAQWKRESDGYGSIV